MKKIINIIITIIFILNIIDISFANTWDTNIASVISWSWNTESWAVVEVKKDYLVRLKEIHDWFFAIKENENYKKIWFDNMLFLTKSIWTNYDSEKYYNKVSEYLSTKTDPKSIEFLKYMKENEFFFRLVLPWIKNKEYKSELRNPFNSQWTFQLSKLEWYLSSQNCSNDVYLYNDCSIILELYKPQKQLTEFDNVLQYLDMVWFIKWKFGNFSLMDINSNTYGIYNQVETLFKLLNMKYTKEELETLIKNYNYKTRWFIYDDKNIQSLYDKNVLQLNSVMITKTQNMKYFVEITMYNIIGSLYNGVWNVWNIEWYGSFVYDNWYVSNNSKEWLKFYQINQDYWTETSLVEWYWSSFFSMLYTWDEKWYSFQLNSILLMKKYFQKISKK